MQQVDTCPNEILSEISYLMINPGFIKDYLSSEMAMSQGKSRQEQCMKKGLGRGEIQMYFLNVKKKTTEVSIIIGINSQS